MTATETAPIEKGSASTCLDVPVDDKIYCMQDKYSLPYTTVDENGNTVVSVVEKVETAYPTEDFPERDYMQASLHVKLFKNCEIKVEAQNSTGKEKTPHERCFLDATTTALAWNAKGDLYLREIQNSLLRNSVKNKEWTTCENPSPISALKYSVFNDNSDINLTSSQTTTTYVTLLKPYLTQTPATVNYNWRTETDATYTHHIKYWQGLAKANPVINAAQRIREIMQSRIAPLSIIRRTHLGRTTDIREIRARQTLRRLIGEEAFQKYSAKGFITYKGLDRTYQIFPGHGRVAVWQKGKQIEQLCVVLTGDFPPTDSVIMRLLFLQESEERFKKTANVFSPSYAPSNNRYQAVNEIHVQEELKNPLSLSELFAKLKEQQNQSLHRIIAQCG